MARTHWTDAERNKGILSEHDRAVSELWQPDVERGYRRCL